MASSIEASHSLATGAERNPRKRKVTDQGAALTTR
jgi:hypothetical protein